MLIKVLVQRDGEYARQRETDRCCGKKRQGKGKEKEKATMNMEEIRRMKRNEEKGIYHRGEPESGEEIERNRGTKK